MVEKQENVFYYLTLLNENYAQPGLQLGTEGEIIKGMYRLMPAAEDKKLQVNLLGAGSILRESVAAKALLEADWGVGAHVWSCPSFNLLARDGQDADRWNMLHPEDKPRVPFVSKQLQRTEGPVIASTDYVKALPEQIRAFIPKDAKGQARGYTVLGTDGFGRSDFRYRLREHFEINRHYIVVAALKQLADQGSIPKGTVLDAIRSYGLDVDKINPLYA